MAQKVLLPELKSDSAYKPEDGVVRLNFSEHIEPVLAPAELVGTGRGIPSAWWSVYGFKWALANEKDGRFRPAIETLRLFVLLQFVGVLDGKIIEASDEGLRRFLKLLRNQDPSAISNNRAEESYCYRDSRGRRSPLLAWKKDGEIIAGSHPEAIFFPAANVSDDMLASLKKELLSIGEIFASFRRFEDPFPLQESAIIKDPVFARSLADYLERLTKAGNVKTGEEWRAALRVWMGELRESAGRIGASSLLTRGLQWIDVSAESNDRVVVDFCSWNPVGVQNGWNCSACASENQFWTTAHGTPIVVSPVPSSTLLLKCPVHASNIQKGSTVDIGSGRGRALFWEDLGACWSNGKLYIWKDEAAWPPTRTEASEVLEDLGEVRHHFGQITVVLKGQLIDPAGVLVDRTPNITRAVPDDSAPPNATFRTGAEQHGVDVPLRGEYLALLERCEKQPNAWSITLKGRREPVRRNLQPTARAGFWETSTILVWPPRTAKGWAVDYVAASTSRGAEARYRIWYEDQDSRLVSSEARSVDRLYRVPGRAKYIELGGLVAGRFDSLGLMEALRPEVTREPGAEPGLVVLDLGTSNSAVLWKTDQPLNFFKAGVLQQELISSGCLLTFSRVHYRNLCEAIAVILPWYYADTQMGASAGSPANFVPSLLAVPGDPEANPCIPPRKLSVLLLEKEQTQGRLYPNLKWENWAANRDKLETLLSLLLLPALWGIRETGATSFSLRATYPLAFDEGRREDYGKELFGVCALLEQYTGLTLIRRAGTDTSSPIVLLSESEAGANGFLKTAHQLSLTLDLGGGTLDIAMFMGDTPLGNRKQAKDLIAFDSLNYGGRDFLRASLTACEPIVKEIFGQTEGRSWSEKLKNYAEYLESEIQSDGRLDIASIIRRRCTSSAKEVIGVFENRCRSQLSYRAQALFAGILLYVRRLLEASVSDIFGEERAKPELNVYLLGQGWGLIPSMINPSETINRVMQRLLASMYCEIDAVEGDKASRDNQMSLLHVNYRTNSKTAVVEGAALMVARDIDSRKPGLQNRFTNQVVIPTFVGVDVASRNDLLLNKSQRLSEVPPRDRSSDCSKRLADLTSREIRSAYERVVDELLLHVAEAQRGRILEFYPNLRDKVAALAENALLLRWPVESDSTLKASLLSIFLEDVWRNVWAMGEISA